MILVECWPNILKTLTYSIDNWSIQSQRFQHEGDLCRDHADPPQQAPPNLCQQPQCGRGEAGWCCCQERCLICHWVTSSGHPTKIYNFLKGCTARWSLMVVDTWTTPSSGKTSAPEVWQPFIWRNFTDFPGSGEPEGELEAAIVRDFGSVAAMKEKLSASTVAVQVLSKG